ncbi:MAG: DEAD/DEAH box helicase [Anaerolineae bacterium]|nr:DEAD/DEAH box helicase [Anaerolineae bacterium]
MTLETLLARWRNDPHFEKNISAWHTMPAREARFDPFPDNLHFEIQNALHNIGIKALYKHQSHAWQLFQEGRHISLVTDTASGKTLGYNLPIIDKLIRNPDDKALYLFPTKALAQDQLAGMSRLIKPFSTKFNLIPALYDGDTSRIKKSFARKNARIIISNPDMMHIGILPHHATWSAFFANLRYIVIDEIHNYRGVFGSHVANVIRRLKRIANFYGTKPQFILTSATIGNPHELAHALIEEQVICIKNDGSARGEKHFLIYNPPILNSDLGLRASALNEAVRIVEDLLDNNLQTIVFGRTRRAVETMLKILREKLPSNSKNIVRAYRSGYLPKHRREIERDLRSAAIKAVIATTALELGIDIGGLKAAILTGYPGTIAGTWQQVGRAGRGTDTSLAVLISSSNVIDQFFSRHPKYFFQRTPEHALINPDNLLILIQHIQCAAFELHFEDGESFGNLDGSQVYSLLLPLLDAGVLHQSNGKYFWMSDHYPAAKISLRSASANAFSLICQGQGRQNTIGKVDGESAPWMVHPGAIYLHEGDCYKVISLEIDEHQAILEPVDVDYYTKPQQNSDVQLINIRDNKIVNGGRKAHGELLVILQVSGYKKIRWESQEFLAAEKLELPPTKLSTSGYWLSLSEESIHALDANGLWKNNPAQYGPSWKETTLIARSRDQYCCQACGTSEKNLVHHVHHKQPLRAFQSYHQANKLENLITLCPGCHQLAEKVVRIRSGLSGAAYTLSHLAPLFLMCDERDLGIFSDPQSILGNGQPSLVIYEMIPAGIGFSQRLFECHDQLINHSIDLISNCSCSDGCPSCVGPGGEFGTGGKKETLAIFLMLQPT